ncbi:hypothetical protein FF1_040245 [Malus domestica]
MGVSPPLLAEALAARDAPVCAGLAGCEGGNGGRHCWCWPPCKRTGSDAPMNVYRSLRTKSNRLFITVH